MVTLMDSFTAMAAALRALCASAALCGWVEEVAQRCCTCSAGRACPSHILMGLVQPPPDPSLHAEQLACAERVVVPLLPLAPLLWPPPARRGAAGPSPAAQAIARVHPVAVFGDVVKLLGELSVLGGAALRPHCPRPLRPLPSPFEFTLKRSGGEPTVWRMARIIVPPAFSVPAPVEGAVPAPVEGAVPAPVEGAVATPIRVADLLTAHCEPSFDRDFASAPQILQVAASEPLSRHSALPFKLTLAGATFTLSSVTISSAGAGVYAVTKYAVTTPGHPASPTAPAPASATHACPAGFIGALYTLDTGPTRPLPRLLVGPERSAALCDVFKKLPAAAAAAVPEAGAPPPAPSPLASRKHQQAARHLEKLAAQALGRTQAWTKKHLDSLGAPRAACLHATLSGQLVAGARRHLANAPGAQKSPTGPSYLPRVHAAMAALIPRLRQGGEEGPAGPHAAQQWARQRVFGAGVLEDFMEAFVRDLGVERQDLISFCLTRSPLLQPGLRALLLAPGANGVRLLITQCGLADLELNREKGPGNYSSFSVSACAPRARPLGCCSINSR